VVAEHFSADLAQKLIKDPYNFDLLTLTTQAQERDLELVRSNVKLIACQANYSAQTRQRATF